MAAQKPTNMRAPVANPVTSFWNSAPRALDDHRTTPDLPASSDVVIIGAGFAGMATAYHILKDNPSPPSITILEARKVCSGASGRNGGHVKPDTYFNVPKYTKLYGADEAAKLAAFEASNVYAVKELVESEGLDCDFHLTRAVDVYLDPAHAKQTEAAYRELLKAGKVSGVKGAKCCFSFTAAHLWPAKMIHQILQRLLEKGAINLQANTPVSSISETPDADGSWTVQTPRGAIRAGKVVVATNGYTAQVLPQHADRIVPVRGICSRITSARGAHTPHLVNTYGIRFDGVNNDYLIPRADGSIVVGGARQMFWHRRAEWFDNVRGDGYMQRLFRGWEDSGAEVDRVWTGIMGYSSDFMPHLGAVPGRPGQFIIAGFSGHGMPEILLSSKGVAAMVRDGIAFAETGLPGVMETSEARISRRDSPLEEGLKSVWEGEAEVKAKL
ncbi:FAD dependent oxidoreductase [Colletotrichum camelliae]|nr:FAD dependent oxidoreductase [Colletotrichum camelliae]